MRAPISVVIPTLNAEAPLTGCLTALMEGLEAGPPVEALRGAITYAVGRSR